MALYLCGAEMLEDGFGKGGKGNGKGRGGKGGKGKKGKDGKGKSNAAKPTCHNCGKPGHYIKDCWSAGGGAANKGQQPKKSYGKDGYGSKGKKGKKGQGPKNGVNSSEEADDDGYHYEEGQVEPEAEAQGPCLDPCYVNGCASATTNGEHEGPHMCAQCVEDESNDRGELSENKWIHEYKFEYVVDRTACFHFKVDPSQLYERSSGEGFNAEVRGSDRISEVAERSDCQRRGRVERQAGNNFPGRHARSKRPRRSESDLWPGRLHVGACGCEQASSSSALPLGTSSGLIVHRTLEMMEIANLDVEIRDKAAEIEDAEDEETVARLTAEVEQLKDRKEKLKERAREEDGKAKAIKKAGQFKLTSENVLSQEWHDRRYYAARKAGVSHSAAWAQEKKRRRATLSRQEGQETEPGKGSSWTRNGTNPWTLAR